MLKEHDNRIKVFGCNYKRSPDPLARQGPRNDLLHAEGIERFQQIHHGYSFAPIDRDLLCEIAQIAGNSYDNDVRA